MWFHSEKELHAVLKATSIVSLSLSTLTYTCMHPTTEPWRLRYRPRVPPPLTLPWRHCTPLSTRQLPRKPWTSQHCGEPKLLRICAHTWLDWNCPFRQPSTSFILQEQRERDRRRVYASLFWDLHTNNERDSLRVLIWWIFENVSESMENQYPRTCLERYIGRLDEDWKTVMWNWMLMMTHRHYLGTFACWRLWHCFAFSTTNQDWTLSF